MRKHDDDDDDDDDDAMLYKRALESWQLSQRSLPHNPK